MIQTLIEQLEAEHILPFEDLIRLLTEADDDDRAFLFQRARAVTDRYYGHDIYTRGLIEFTTIVKMTVCTAVYAEVTAMWSAIV